MFLAILLYTVQFATPSPLFPEHVDLQKIGEVILKNEIYNILKPTTHIITDHFKDVMLRRDTNTIPSKRVFIDKNGFRHYWSGFEEEEPLRKFTLRSNDTVKGNQTDISAVKEASSTTVDGKENNTLTVNDKKKRPKRLKDIPLEPVTPSSIILRQSDAGKTMTIAKTTFYCPFIGVLTMTSRLD
ncbi:unnamed protein product [Diatraea saccharalis]|uniref:Uncharacterized protein n=1 Tax=Diatraea saccharalis TaxID=40085 RepID=A0A9N9WD87_9NEOP|nr:unnamed protein product [Diatraea saccharalis]